MQELQSPLRSGQQVEVRDEPWLVIDTERFDDATLVTLRGVGHDNLGEMRRVLAPFDRVRAIVPRRGLTRQTRHAVLRTAADAVAASPRWRDCWTAGTARIDLRPWQLEPALAVIGGATRILLADHVGLGKTIQAALIVAELLARALASRVLVLTPASLREQWAAELSEKFGMTATVLDQASLAAISATLPLGVNPWSTAGLIVSSIDLVKRPEVRVALDVVPLDVLVVDEAHHLTPGTDRGAVVADLAARTPWVVLATATPHSGDEEAYRFLRGLGDAAGRDELITYRRAAQEVRDLPRRGAGGGATVSGVGSRRVRLMAITPTAAERALLDATLAYARTLWQGEAAHPGAHLVGAVIARRAASSASAARATLERRLSLLKEDMSHPQRPGSPTRVCQRGMEQTPLPWDEGDGGDAGEPDSVLAQPGLLNRRDEVAWIERLIRLADDATTSSKVAAVRRLLRRTTEHLIIFSEYRDVVQGVALALADFGPLGVLHGGLSASARQDVIRSFVGGQARVLITTDAAGEGLNLQARCRLVVNLELPWSPLRLEQRIGRVDRIGQTRRVHAVHLAHRGSFEDTVLARLNERRARAALDIGTDAVWGEREVVAAVLSGTSLTWRPFPQSPRRPPTSSIECEKTAVTERRLRSLARRGHHELPITRPVYARDARAGLPTACVLLLFAADLIDGNGRVLQRELVPLRLELELPIRLRALPRDLLLQLVEHSALSDALRMEMERRAVTARTDTARSAAGIERRAADLLAALARRNRPLFQGSLFDRRREQQSQARADAISLWQAHLVRRRDAAQALTHIESAPARLVAAWLW